MVLAPHNSMLSRPVLFSLVLAVALQGPMPAHAGPLGWVKGRVQATKGWLARQQQKRQTIRELKRIDPLLVPAFKSMKRAYAPFSGCQVGAALTIKRRGPLSWIPGLRNKVVRGFNSESQGDLQICAERAAMAGLPRGMSKNNPVRKIAIVSGGSVSTPCGRCLQVASEVGSPETRIVAANLKGQHKSFRLSELLPSEFKPAAATALAPYRGLIAKAVRAYRRSGSAGINHYRPAIGAAVETTGGKTYLGMVIKDTASTFTPATQTPLDRVAQTNALSGKKDRVRTVVIAGQGTGRWKLPVPTADERQHLFDMNPNARVVLFNPKEKMGAVVSARELLPHAYQR